MLFIRRVNLPRQKKGALDDLFNEFGEIREDVDDSVLHHAVSADYAVPHSQFNEYGEILDNVAPSTQHSARPTEFEVSNTRYNDDSSETLQSAGDSAHPPVSSSQSPPARSGGAGVAVIAVIVLAVLGYFLFGIPGYGGVGGHESVPAITPQQTPASTAEYTLVAEGQGEPDILKKGFFSLHTDDFESGEYAFPVSLTSPPLYIDYSVVPEILSRQKVVYSSPSDPTGELIEYSRPSDNSWFEITVTNEVGDVVVQDGFGKLPDAKSGYGRDIGHFKVFVNGNYMIEIQFNNMIVDIDIK